MKKMYYFIITRLFIFVALCAMILSLNSHTPAVAQKGITVGVIDIEKVMVEWPKFQNYSEQIVKEELAYTILFEKASPNMTDAEKSEMQYQISQILDHSNFILMEALTSDMSKAAEKIAIEKGYNMVLIKQSVHFGGEDMTESFIELLK